MAQIPNRPASPPTDARPYPPLEFCEMPVAALHPDPRNPRKHPRWQIRKIKSAIEHLGFRDPLTIDENNTVLGGNGRLAAAKALGMETVPVIRLLGMSEAEKRAYVLATNRLAELGGWNNDMLATEIAYIEELDINLDLEVTGFEIAEIDQLVLDATAPAPDKIDQVPAIDRTHPAVTQPGDLWICGEHRILCGDSTQKASFERLMARALARMGFVDPPYNLRIRHNVSGLGYRVHDEFAMGSGEFSREQHIEFLKKSLGYQAAASVDGALHFVCSDWRHMGENLAAGEEVFSELKNLCIWNKTNAGMGSMYRSQHELVFVWKNGRASHINNIQLGKHGRTRSNIWLYPGATALHKDRDSDLAAHPTVKPVGMVADAILDCTKRHDVVLDSFAGSATTLLAAHRTGRRGYGIELDPWYVDIALGRLSALTGLTAIHAETGRTFADMARDRLGSGSQD